MGKTLHHGPLTDGQRDLASRNFPLACLITGDWLRRYPSWDHEVDWEDRVKSAAHLGLVKAARCYTPGRKFSSLLRTCVNREIRDVLRSARIRRRFYMELFDRMKSLERDFRSHRARPPRHDSL